MAKPVTFIFSVLIYVQGRFLAFANYTRHWLLCPDRCHRVLRLEPINRQRNKRYHLISSPNMCLHTIYIKDDIHYVLNLSCFIMFEY